MPLPKENGTVEYRSLVATPINLFRGIKSGTGIATLFLTLFHTNRLPPGGDLGLFNWRRKDSIARSVKNIKSYGQIKL